MNCKQCNILKSYDNYLKDRRVCKECLYKNRKCEHNIPKTRCKECSGSAFCKHDKVKTLCKECGGSQICEHNKRKSRCKDCNGGSICEHNKLRDTCKDCDGSQICEHDKQKQTCKECNGNQICEHNVNKHRCIDCNGSQICEHKHIKSNCKECKGSAFCEHDKYKHQCIICTPNSNSFCKSCRLFRVGKITNYLCAYCNPDKPDRIKHKELKVKIFLEENNYEFEYNKHCKYKDCSYFPDFKINCGNYFIIIECDEYAHKNYDKKDEKIREDNIRLALDKKCIFLRYNPDNVKRKKKIKIESKQKILKSYIEYYINKGKCDNEIIYLFY
jgi:hypothetical protein